LPRTLQHVAFVAVALVLRFGLVSGAQVAQAPARSARVAHPFVGVTTVDRTESVPRAIHIHVVQVDLTASGIRFLLSEPRGSREVERETTLAFLRRTHAQVAINGHFFLPFPSTDTEAWVVGFGVSEGRVFSAFETPEQSYAIVANAPAVNIDSHNRASIVHRDPAAADGRRVAEPVELWTTVAGSAQIVTAGQVTIPVYRDATHPTGVLTPGGPRNYSNENSWYDVVTARSAIGLSRDGRTLTLFVVDARGDSVGLRVGEVAGMLKSDYSVWDALNLDGGGSSSMATADPAGGEPFLVNTSSDNPLGRSVGSSLAVFAKVQNNRWP
jgi:hypothetical protein